MDNFLRKPKEFLLELFFPSFCFGCLKEGTFLCQDCTALLEVNEYNYCLCNKNPLRLHPEQKSGKCGRCQQTSLAGLYFALPYQEKPLTRKLIHHFKYEPYVKALAPTLASLIINHLVLSGKNKNDIWDGSVLTYVPSQIASLKRRGYNQSHELAKELAAIVKIPVISNNLVKTKKTRPQMQLTAKEREENLKGVFAIKSPAAFAGKKVFLVDDVYTTGSTMEECSKVLKEIGAKIVWGITIAREG